METLLKTIIKGLHKYGRHQEALSYTRRLIDIKNNKI